MINILARKGTINLVKYDNGLYAVDKITKSIGMSHFVSENKEDAINAFIEIAKATRRSKNDFNLEIYGVGV